MPSVNITTTPSKAFEIPQGAWGYRVNNVSDETIYTLENAAVTTSTGIPLAAGAERTVCFAEKAQNAMSLQAVHGGTGNKSLRYEILTVQVQATTRTAAAGASFATITGAPSDNAALAAALALKLDKTGGIITGNGAASTPALKFTGTPFSGGTSETTKPLFLLEPSGTTSNNWSTGGTVLGVNAASGFTGDLLVGQLAGANRVRVNYLGQFFFGSSTNPDGLLGTIQSLYGTINLRTGGDNAFTVLAPLRAEGQNNGIGAFSESGIRSGVLYPANDISNCLEMRVGSNPQILRLYNLFTDSSNYERLGLITAAGDYEIAAEAAGTGTRRNLKLNGANRAAYDAAPSTTVIRDILISHGLMAAS